MTTDRGVLCLAQNNGPVDYVRLAYLQCLSLKLTNPGIPYALVTDMKTSISITEKQRSLFDHVILLPQDLAHDQAWKQRNECQLFGSTPFRETIKVEADLLFTSSMDAWWRPLRNRDVVMSLGCVDYRGRTATIRSYRKVFDANCLPDVYTGLMYWRLSDTAKELFDVARQIYLSWDQVKQQLTMCPQREPGSTDLVFAIAASIIGPDLVTLHKDHAFRMAHFKADINGWKDTLPWYQQCVADATAPRLCINGHQQQHPVHYHDKSWPTDAMIKDYEHALDLG
jgi:hypothetical protein